MPRNIATSVRDRLLAASKQADLDFQFFLWRYAMERLLYRISLSDWADSLVVKGAMLYAFWSNQLLRPTRDLDLRSRQEASVGEWVQRMQSVLAVSVPDDGLRFDVDVRGEVIHEEQKYPGVRVKIVASLDRAKIALQVDIGVGDPMVVPPVEEDLPSLLPGFTSPRIRRYAHETYVAEKFEAMVDLDMANSRLKDFWDLHYVAQTFSLAADSLRRSFEATFGHRKTRLPQELPVALTASFWSDPEKVRMWIAFLNKTFGSTALDLSLSEVGGVLEKFLMPVSRNEVVGLVWRPGGPWG